MVEKLKIGSIVIRCHEFDKMLAFWQEALHYMTTEQGLLRADLSVIFGAADHSCQTVDEREEHLRPAVPDGNETCRVVVCSRSSREDGHATSVKVTGIALMLAA